MTDEVSRCSKDETEILLEFFAQEFPDIGQSEFHFRIGAADVAVVLLGVVVFLLRIMPSRIGMGPDCPRGNYDAFDFQMQRSEPEVDLVVAPTWTGRI